MSENSAASCQTPEVQDLIPSNGTENSSPINEAQPYDAAFFSWQSEESLVSARRVIALLFDSLFRPTSVIDVGCGMGPWLRAAQENGVKTIKGIDGDYVDRALFCVDPRFFEPYDLNTPINESGRYDLVISLEVAEHLLPERGPSFIADLCKLSDVVLFSAALPFQGGTDHVHEQWLEFWAIEFGRHGFKPYDFLRDQLWNDFTVASWYRQNMVIFAKPEAAAKWKQSVAPARADRLSRVHPEITVINAGRLRANAYVTREGEKSWYQSLVGQASSLTTDAPNLFNLPPQLSNQAAVAHLKDLIKSRIYVDNGGEAFRAMELGYDEANELRTKIHSELARRDSQVLSLATKLAEAEANLARTQLDDDESLVEDIVELTDESAQVETEQTISKSRFEFFRDIWRLFSKNPRSNVWRRYWSFRESVKLINASLLFDPIFYLNSYPDIAATGIDPLQHYLLYGAYEGRDPHPLFSSSFYLRNNDDVKRHKLNPLSHFLKSGANEGRPAHPLFDTGFYLQGNPDVRASKQNPLEHYLRFGANEKRDPHPCFSTSYYLKHNSDVSQSGYNPLVHYVLCGAKELRRPHPWLADAWVDLHALKNQAVPSDVQLQASKIIVYDALLDGSIFDDEFFESKLLNPEEFIPRLVSLGTTNRAWLGCKTISPYIQSAITFSESSGFMNQVREFDTAATQRLEKYIQRLERGILLTPSNGISNNRSDNSVTKNGDLTCFSDPISIVDLAPTKEISSWFASKTLSATNSKTKSEANISVSSSTPSFSIITPFYRHLEYFGDCAISVLDLFSKINNQDATVPKLKLEWVIVNDDPDVSESDLLAEIPAALHAIVKIRSEKTHDKIEHRGLAKRLNEAMQYATCEWILLLDCDDRISADACNVLTYYIAEHPQCRYFSSSLIDIDASGSVLRHRQRTASPIHLFDDGMAAGPLQCIRRDLIESFGGLAINDGDSAPLYYFALRTSYQEPLCYIPEYLYSYRWHGNALWNSETSTSKNRFSQAQFEFAKFFLTANPDQTLQVEKNGLGALPNLRQPNLSNSFLGSTRNYGNLDRDNSVVIENENMFVVLERFSESSSSSTSNLIQFFSYVVVDSDGENVERLLEVVDSIKCQALPCLPIVVLRSSQKLTSGIVKLLSAREQPIVLLRAPDRCKTSSCSLNIALRYIYENSSLNECTGASGVTFLSESDILYPLYSAQISERLRILRRDGSSHTVSADHLSDVIYCSSNCKEVVTKSKTGNSGKISTTQIVSKTRACLPAPCILVDPCIPLSCCWISLNALRSSKLMFDERLSTLQDWHFVVKLLCSGFSFLPLCAALTETRSSPDKRNLQDDVQRRKAALLITEDIRTWIQAIPRPELFKDLLSFAQVQEQQLDEYDVQTIRKTNRLLSSNTLLTKQAANFIAPESLCP